MRASKHVSTGQLDLFSGQTYHVSKVVKINRSTAEKMETNKVAKVIQLRPAIPKARPQKIPSTPNVQPHEEPSKITYQYEPRTMVREEGDYAGYDAEICTDGAKPHPTALCESLAMAAVNLPKPTYQPVLLPSVIAAGRLSEAQLEDVICAGQAHSQFLPSGKRLGYMIGSGTGFGKGNTISGIIIDNFAQGRKKAVWISKNGNAHLDSKHYWQSVGGNQRQFIDHQKIKWDAALKHTEGILCTTYGLLKTKFEYIQEDPDALPILDGRIKQIVKWLGYDFDGVIAFDESHLMANAIDQNGKRGLKKSSQVAKVGLALQEVLPKARIVYSSATGATEVQNLVYASRLGLYGEGTSFPASSDFIEAITKSGVAGMELIAHDLKALGRYTARSLSYDGVTYGTVVHEVTPGQKELYDRLARAWQNILLNMEQALKINQTAKNGRAAALSAFWSTHQRFFNLIILTMQLPSVIADIEEQIEAGHAIVIQLINTNEAQMKRAIAEQKAEGVINMEELDISPKSIVIEFIRKTFPIYQYVPSTDSEGNEIQVMATDSEGEPIINSESLAKRERLIEKIQNELQIPQGPLDSFIHHFGADQVAEITGRTLRVVPSEDDEGRIRFIEEKRSRIMVKREISEFNDDKRRILIFSEAGGTGASFHADRNIANQRLRVHYAYQPGWRADVAVQGFGRSHRSNQAQPPEFKLCCTNLHAQKRFLSSIARRLQQLGALTKGQRSTGGQGILDDSFNFESHYAEQALYLTYMDIQHQHEPITPSELQAMMGLKLIVEEDGEEKLNVKILGDTKTFLNRMLSLEVDVMNKVFLHFENKMVGLINQAKANGSFEKGIEFVQAEKTVLLEELPIYEHPETKAQAILTTLQLEVKVKKRKFEQEGASDHNPEFLGYYLNPSNNMPYAAFNAFNRVDEEGKVTEICRLESVVRSHHIEASVLATYRVLNRNEARSIWDQLYREIPETKTEYHTIIKALLLPIWNKIPGHVQVRRYIDENGNTHLGRVVTKNHLAIVRRSFNLQNQYSVQEVYTAIREKAVIQLDNGLKIKGSIIQGVPSMEITSLPRSRATLDILDQLGFVIRIKNKMMDLKSAHLPRNLILETLPKLMQALNTEIQSVHYPGEE